ncbi:MAG TPA: hypothetical protein VN380_19210 [Thermoanaerobaculia bacterium]|jgi:hypothetical protein|nr:hypothetical protein [Thermoanaerobaculia bacterium]
MSTNEKTMDLSTAADVLRPAPATLAPEEIVDQLRAISTRMGEVTPLTAAQRKALRGRIRTPDPVLQASINVIGALDNVSQAVGQPADEVRSLQSEANRWTAVEDELRKMLNGVSGANLIRRLRVDLIAAQAYTIGSQLARDPANAILVPHVEEIKRLKRFSRRKKAAQDAGTAADEQPVTEGSGTSGDPKA